MRTMERTHHRRRVPVYAPAVVVGIVFWAACGFIADKDRIKIAKVRDTYITRGDLFKVIREMPDDERPIIRNKGDLLRVLNAYIDDQIRGPLVQEVEQQFAGQGKPLVSREAAKQRYFSEHAEDDYASMYAVDNAAAVGMSQAQLEIMKQQIDLGIDRTLEKMKSETAVALRAVQAFKEGKLKITDAEYEQEYKLRKEGLKKLEWMEFAAFRFPVDMPNSEAEAAAVRRRLDAGESFDALQAECKAKDPSFVLRSEIENNPGLAKFSGFWMNASGSQKGDILGPIYLPEYQMMGSPDAQGRAAVKNMPAAYLVLKVLDHRPETPMTLDEAKLNLMPFILIGKMMTQLREDNGVVIYEKQLPDPAMFTDKYGQPSAGSI
jgi:hypothetical protein